MICLFSQHRNEPASGYGGLASIAVEKPGTDQGFGHYLNPGAGPSNFTFDGNIDGGGNAHRADYAAGYGGLWEFDNFDSGVRLGESDVTPVAVYATWREDQPPQGWNNEWETDVVYEITGTADGQPHRGIGGESGDRGNRGKSGDTNRY